MPPRRLAALLAASALGAFATAGVMQVVLHVDRRWGPIDPVTRMLSDYAWSAGWWLWAASLILTAAGSAAVLVALTRQRVLAGWPAVSAMACACAGLLAIAVFTKDPGGGAVTPTGKAHLYAAAVSCVSLPLVGWLLSRRHGGTPRWRRYAAWSKALGLAAITFYLPFIVEFVANVILGSSLPAVPAGLVERVMAVLELALLTVLAVWARQAATGWDCPARNSPVPSRSVLG